MGELVARRGVGADGSALKTIISLALTFIAAPCMAQPIPASDTEVQAFMAADRNGDGVLSPAEFRAFIQAMARAGQPTARRIRFFGAYDYAFSIVDTDADGVVTPSELRRGDDSHRFGQ